LLDNASDIGFNWSLLERRRLKEVKVRKVYRIRVKWCFWSFYFSFICLLFAIFAILNPKLMPLFIFALLMIVFMVLPAYYVELVEIKENSKKESV
jgi:type IV secretory pathway component VirB8